MLQAALCALTITKVVMLVYENNVLMIIYLQTRQSIINSLPNVKICHAVHFVSMVVDAVKSVYFNPYKS